MLTPSMSKLVEQEDNVGDRRKALLEEAFLFPIQEEKDHCSNWVK